MDTSLTLLSPTREEKTFYVFHSLTQNKNCTGHEETFDAANQNREQTN